MLPPACRDPILRGADGYFAFFWITAPKIAMETGVKATDKELG